MRMTAWHLLICLSYITTFANTDAHATSAEDRARKHFNISSTTPVNEESIRAAVLQLLPIGTPASLIKSKLAQVEIGKDSLSSYNEINNALHVIRIEFDSKTFAIVQTSYLISLHLSQARTIQEISVKKWLTGP